MYDIAIIGPKSILDLVKAQKVLWCLLLYKCYLPLFFFLNSLTIHNLCYWWYVIYFFFFSAELPLDHEFEVFDHKDPKKLGFYPELPAALEAKKA